MSAAPGAPRRPRRLAVALGVLLGLPLSALGLRAVLAPRETAPQGLVLSPAERERVAALAAASDGEARLRALLPRLEVLLVGEEHFYLETQAWLASLLETIPERRVALLLELPASLQPAVEERVETGRSDRLAAAIREREALPLDDLLGWAHRNRRRLSRVAAMDEDRARILLNRTFLRDTRNATMARAVLAARRDLPGDLVVAYGGQMHMLLSGRYRYDVENRTPTGARLLGAGVPRDRIASVLLSGRGKAPLSEAWPGPGVLSMEDAIGAEPWPLFVDEALFGVRTGRDLADFFVPLGPLTRVPRASAAAR